MAAVSAAVKPKREKTAYHVLRRTSVDEGDGVYKIVGKDIAASNGDLAIKLFASKAGDQAEGKYVAVPSRSFVETTVKVETTTVVKLGTG